MSALEPALLSQIPVDEAELRAALQSAAVPGFTGSLQVEFGLVEEVEMGEHRYRVRMSVSRQQHSKAGEDSPSRQVLPDPTRRKPVESVLAQLKPRLVVRPVIQALEVHLKDGVVQTFKTKE